MKTYATLRDTILHHPAIRYWLRDAIKALESKDPVDALVDAETLAALMKMRCDEILGEVRS